MSEALPQVRRGGVSNLSHTIKNQSEDELSNARPRTHPAGQRLKVSELQQNRRFCCSPDELQDNKTSRNN